jgi:hypothetical protein
VARVIRVSQQEVLKPLHQDSRSHEVCNPDRGDETLKGQPRACVRVSVHRDSGVGEPSCSTPRVPKS